MNNDTDDQESRAWLGEIRRETGLDEAYALVALSEVLRDIRESMTPEERARFAETLPGLIRRMYWESHEKRALDRHVLRAVLRVLERHLPTAVHIARRHAQLLAEEHNEKQQALHAEKGHERGAPMAPHQNRSPGEQHRGGPLPNRK